MLTCPKCQGYALPDAKNCPTCGHDLSQPAVPPGLTPEKAFKGFLALTIAGAVAAGSYCALQAPNYSDSAMPVMYAVLALLQVFSILGVALIWRNMGGGLAIFTTSQFLSSVIMLFFVPYKWWLLPYLVIAAMWTMHSLCRNKRP